MKAIIEGLKIARNACILNSYDQRIIVKGIILRKIFLTFEAKNVFVFSHDYYSERDFYFKSSIETVRRKINKNFYINKNFFNKNC